MTHLLQPPPKRWVCANGCSATAVTPWDTPNRFHTCPRMAGLTSPLVPEGTGARVRAVEREDYVGKEDVRMDGNGRPVMAIVTERPDGSNDCVVFAPAAHGGGES
jgi:hypothetical protein